MAAVAAIVALVSSITLTSAHAAEPEKLNCHGGNITISGEHRLVELANCAVVRVEGSYNNITGRLPKRAKVFVTGNGNVVALQPPNGVSFSRIKDMGQDNKVGGPG
jgi:hypothetical protein